MPPVAAYEYLQHIVLGILKLDRVGWPRINMLSITYPPLCGHSIESVVIDEQTAVDFKRIIQYFGQNMCCVVVLNLSCPTDNNADDLVNSNLVSTYGGQLQVLRIGAPVSFDFPHYFRNIAVLELTLSLGVARGVPSVCGGTLKVLKLYDVPRNFVWRHFRYDLYTGPIVFCRLSILHLFYDYELHIPTVDEMQGKAASGAHSCDQLVFPALKQLDIRNCTPDCDLLYAEAPFAELGSVRVAGLLNEISYCSRLKLVWVRDLHIELDISESDEAVQICNVTNHFFSRICIGQTAILEIGIGRFTLDPELIRWINLTKLGVVSINFKTLCRVIARLPNLTDFEAYFLEFGAATVEGLVVDESLFSSTDPLLAWGAKLATVTVNTLDEDCPLAVNAYGIQSFILNAGALIGLAVPELVEPHVYAFVDTFKDSYPHLANITVYTS
ncbi:hypothetical protein IW152_002877 [Coemansia sp. BCRC 34962]|nr:hypothetical protein IW152_002877 [Coemansia sp. BCRC 34962]